MDVIAKLKKLELDDEVKRLRNMQEVYDRLCANHAMYLRCGDYEVNDRFADKEITEDAMVAKIKHYEEKIKNQKIKIEKMKKEKK